MRNVSNVFYFVVVAPTSGIFCANKQISSQRIVEQRSALPVPEFRLPRLIEITSPIQSTTLPADSLSDAAHLRKGSKSPRALQQTMSRGARSSSSSSYLEISTLEFLSPISRLTSARKVPFLMLDSTRKSSISGYKYLHRNPGKTGSRANVGEPTRFYGDGNGAKHGLAEMANEDFQRIADRRQIQLLIPLQQNPYILLNTNDLFVIYLDTKRTATAVG